MGGRRLAVLGLLGLAPALAGCPVNARLTTGYRPTSTTLRSAPLPDGLVVHPLAEARPARVYSTQGRMLIAMVPLVPWASMPFERVDETVRLQSERGAQPPAPDFATYAYPASFAHAIADDLAVSGLFRSVAYADDGGKPDARYVLDGTLLETPLVHSKTCYFIGLPGCYLDFLGLPSIKTTARVKLTLELRDTTGGGAIWTRTLEGESDKIFNDAYSSPILYGPSVFSFVVPIPPSSWPVDDRSVFAFHFEALRRAMAEAKPELAAALAER